LRPLNKNYGVQSENRCKNAKEAKAEHIR